MAGGLVLTVMVEAESSGAAVAVAGAVPTATLEAAVFDMAKPREEASLMTMPVSRSAGRISRRAARAKGREML